MAGDADNHDFCSKLSVIDAVNFRKGLPWKGY
jgi:hypothetical protein